MVSGVLSSGSEVLSSDSEAAVAACEDVSFELLVHYCGFSCTVRADQRKDLTLGDFKIHTVHHDLSVVGFCQIFYKQELPGQIRNDKPQKGDGPDQCALNTGKEGSQHRADQKDIPTMLK